MNLDKLKAEWQQYDTRLQLSHTLSDKLITSMIKEKSQSRLSKVKRQYLFGVIYMVAWLIVGAAVIMGNPFDYTQTIEYVPIAIFCLCISVLILGMIKTNHQLQQVEINHENLDTSLKRITKIIEKYQNPNRILGLTLKLLLTTGIALFPLSFLPRKIAQAGLWTGITDTLTPMVISAIIVFIAYKLGAFKERNSKKFKEYSQELNELKALSNELTER